MKTCYILSFILIISILSGCQSEKSFFLFHTASVKPPKAAPFNSSKREHDSGMVLSTPSCAPVRGNSSTQSIKHLKQLPSRHHDIAKRVLRHYRKKPLVKHVSANQFRILTPASNTIKPNDGSLNALGDFIILISSLFGTLFLALLIYGITAGSLAAIIIGAFFLTVCLGIIIAILLDN